MSVDSKIDEIKSARNTIRSKMVAAGQASSSDKLADLADNLTFDKYYSTDDTTESTLANDDYVPFYDTSATAKKKSTWSNIKAKLKTYFDTLYPSKTTVPNPTSGDSTKFLRGDGSWQEVPASGGGHTIEDPEGTALTQRDTLQFGGDLEVSDDDENEKTVVSPHELTTAELTEIMSTLPGTPTDLPVLFDESGAEYQVGWYKYANGTKKPVYEKTIDCGLSPNKTTKTIVHSISNLDKIISINGIGRFNDVNNTHCYIPYHDDDAGTNNVRVNIDNTNITLLSRTFNLGAYIYITIQYTKATDTPS